MLSEPDRRRPRFCPGIDLHLADGQAWTLPAPAAASEATWETQGYRALIEASREAGSPGERSLALIALAIHLLDWNYSLGPTDFDELLDDRGDDRRRADLSVAFRTLEEAHRILPGGSDEITRSSAIRWRRDETVTRPSNHGGILPV